MTSTQSAVQLLKGYLTEWHQDLQRWSENGRLLAAAQEALMLEGTPRRLQHLIDQWASKDFSSIPEIVLLSAADMNGAMGAYAISTGKIYLNKDWLLTAGSDEVRAVLTEELGHHLDGLVNVVDTPGDEGDTFTQIFQGFTRSSSAQILTGSRQDLGVVTNLQGRTVTVEQANINDWNNSQSYSYLTTGDDQFFWYGGSDVVDGLAGVDTFNAPLSISQAKFTRTSDGLIYLSAQGANVALINIEKVSFADGIQDLTTTAFSSTIIDNIWGPNAWNGTDGGDQLFWNVGSDIIDGQAGNDALNIPLSIAQVKFSVTQNGFTYVYGIPDASGVISNIATFNIEKVSFIDGDYLVSNPGKPNAVIVDWNNGGAGGLDLAYSSLTPNDDEFFWVAGTDIVDGQSGIDTVNIPLKAAQVYVTRTTEGVYYANVSDHRGSHSIALLDVERLVFIDGDYLIPSPGKPSSIALDWNSGPSYSILGAGDDSFFWFGGSDVVNGLTGVDSLSVPFSIAQAKFSRTSDGLSYLAAAGFNVALPNVERVVFTDGTQNLQATEFFSAIYDNRWGPNAWNGTDGGDQLFWNVGSDIIDGQAGIDTLNIPLSINQAIVTTDANGIIRIDGLHDSSGGISNLEAKNIEKIAFIDGEYAPTNKTVVTITEAIRGIKLSQYNLDLSGLTSAVVQASFSVDPRILGITRIDAQWSASQGNARVFTTLWKTGVDTQGNNIFTGDLKFGGYYAPGDWRLSAINILDDVNSRSILSSGSHGLPAPELNSTVSVTNTKGDPFIPALQYVGFDLTRVTVDGSGNTHIPIVWKDADAGSGIWNRELQIYDPSGICHVIRENELIIPKGAPAGAWQINNARLDDNADNVFWTPDLAPLSNSLTYIYSSIDNILDIEGAGVGKLDGIRFSNQFTFDLSVGADIVNLADTVSKADKMTVSGGSGLDKLNGNTYDNTLVLTGLDEGTLDGISFSMIESVSLGAGNDVVTLLPGGRLSGLLDGGAGSNSLIVDGTYTIGIGTGGTIVVDNGSGGVGSFFGFQTIQGGGGAGVGTPQSNSMVLNDNSNIVSITGPNSGTAEGTAFTNISDINFAAGDDFAILSAVGSLTGSLSGGNGTDDLTLNSSINTVVLSQSGIGTASSSGNAVSTAFNGFEIIRLDAGNDAADLNLNGSTALTTKRQLRLNGGLGNDQLTLRLNAQERQNLIATNQLAALQTYINNPTGQTLNLNLLEVSLVLSDFESGVLVTPNQTPTDLTLTSSGIAENSSAGTLIGTLSATDPDPGSTFTYALVPGNGTNDSDNALVEIIGNEVRVKSGAIIDFETNPVLNLNIQVSDNGNPAQSFTKSVTASVKDATGLYDLQLSNYTIDLNGSPGTLGARYFVNLDGKQFNEVYSEWTSDGSGYQPFSRWGYVGQNRVYILGGTNPSQNTGILTVDSSLGFNKYKPSGIWTLSNVVLDTTDGTRTVLSTADLNARGIKTTVQVNNPIYGDGIPATIESAALSRQLVVLKNGIPTANQFTWTAKDNLSGIDDTYVQWYSPSGQTITIGATGENGSLLGSFSVDIPLDATSEEGEYILGSIVCVDGAENFRVFSRAELLGQGVPDQMTRFTVQKYTNQAPTDLNLTSVGIQENSTAGTLIGTLSATDPDGGSTFSYALVAGNGTNDVDNALVEIVGNQVRVKSGASIDFETNPVLNLNIQVTDNGNPAQSFTKSVSADVINIIDETPPELISVTLKDGTILLKFSEAVIVDQTPTTAFVVQTISPTTGAATAQTVTLVAQDAVDKTQLVLLVSGGISDLNFRVTYADPVGDQQIGVVQDVNGNDLLSFTRDADNLILTGLANTAAVGNSINNTLTGNNGNNTLNGSTGADAMAGGLGNDTYIVDNNADTVLEAAAAGTDTVQASITYSVAALATVENIILTGAGAINATGNAAANTLTGNSAANVLNGGAGADTMAGGLGNDTYVVNATTDTVTEAAAAGTDTVQSSITYSVAALVNVENITLTGAAALNATGNAAANTLVGNTGNNLLIGGASGDVLTGGIGTDTFRFALTDSLLGSMDRITDFAIGTDVIDGPVAVTAANIRKLGPVSGLTQAGIAAVLTNANFVANGAATFSFGTGASARTFLALNNGTAGFSSTTDAVIEITGFSGALTSLAVI